MFSLLQWSWFISEKKCKSTGEQWHLKGSSRLLRDKTQGKKPQTENCNKLIIFKGNYQMSPLCPRDTYLHYFPQQNHPCQRIPGAPKHKEMSTAVMKRERQLPRPCHTSLLLTTGATQGCANQRREMRHFHKVAKKATENKGNMYLCCHKRIQTSLIENMSAGSAHTPGFSAFLSLCILCDGPQPWADSETGRQYNWNSITWREMGTILSTLTPNHYFWLWCSFYISFSDNQTV